MMGAVVTVSVTGIAIGLFPAWLEDTATAPVYVPAASPVGFTDTLRLPGVCPPPVTLSQVLVASLRLANTRAVELLPTATLCAGGVEPPG